MSGGYSASNTLRVMQKRADKLADESAISLLTLLTVRFCNAWNALL